MCLIEKIKYKIFSHILLHEKNSLIQSYLNLSLILYRYRDYHTLKKILNIKKPFSDCPLAVTNDFTVV